MRTIIAATLALALSGGAALAQSGYAVSPFLSPAERSGNPTPFYNEQPTTGTTTRLGDFVFSTFRNGDRTTNCTSNRLGDTVFTNCN